MPTNRRCDGCEFWELYKNGLTGHVDDAEGFCHRFPPQINTSSAVVDAHEFLDSGADTAEAVALAEQASSWCFPVVFASSWCGEHQQVKTPKD